MDTQPLNHLFPPPIPTQGTHLEVLCAAGRGRDGHLLGLEDGVDGGALAHVGVADHAHGGHAWHVARPGHSPEQLQQLVAAAQVGGGPWKGKEHAHQTSTHLHRWVDRTLKEAAVMTSNILIKSENIFAGGWIEL